MKRQMSEEREWSTKNAEVLCCLAGAALAVVVCFAAAVQRDPVFLAPKFELEVYEREILAAAAAAAAGCATDRVVFLEIGFVAEMEVLTEMMAETGALEAAAFDTAVYTDFGLIAGAAADIVTVEVVAEEDYAFEIAGIAWFAAVDKTDCETKNYYILCFIHFFNLSHIATLSTRSDPDGEDPVCSLMNQAVAVQGRFIANPKERKTSKTGSMAPTACRRRSNSLIITIQR